MKIKIDPSSIKTKMQSEHKAPVYSGSHPMATSAGEAKLQSTLPTLPTFEPIGQGTEGCVYRPPLRCREEALNLKYGNSDYVLKVEPRSTYKINPLAALLRKIDPSQTNFIYPYEEECTIDVPLSELQKHCAPLQREQKSDVVGHFNRYGGITLSQLASSIEEREEEEEDVHPLDAQTVLHWFIDLVKDVVVLQAHGLAHNDLNPDNIVIDEKQHIRIIDFSTLSRISDLQPLHVQVMQDIFHVAASIETLIQPLMDVDETELLKEVQEVINEVVQTYFAKGHNASLPVFTDSAPETSIESSTLMTPIDLLKRLEALSDK